MELHKDQRLLEKLKLGIKVSGFGVGKVDYVQDTITLDARAAAIFDLPSDTPISRNRLHDRIHPDHWAKVQTQFEDLLHPDNDHVLDVEHRVSRSDGSQVWVNARKQVEFLEVAATGTLMPYWGRTAAKYPCTGRSRQRTMASLAFAGPKRAAHPSPHRRAKAVATKF